MVEQKVKGLISFFHPPLLFPFKTVIITTKLSAQGDAGQPGLPGTMGSAGKTVYGASATRVYPPTLVDLVSSDMLLFHTTGWARWTGRGRTCRTYWWTCEYTWTLFIPNYGFIFSKYLLFLFSGRYRTARPSGSSWQARCQGMISHYNASN